MGSDKIETLPEPEIRNLGRLQLFTRTPFSQLYRSYPNIVFIAVIGQRAGCGGSRFSVRFIAVPYKEIYPPLRGDQDKVLSHHPIPQGHR